MNSFLGSCPDSGKRMFLNTFVGFSSISGSVGWFFTFFYEEPLILVLKNEMELFHNSLSDF
jgi:hypothetical protein